MDFYFPDSQDQIDPNYDFITEEHLPFHVRQRDDRYAHEIHDPPPYSGVLVSKTMVDGGGSGGRYTTAHRHRLYRLGVHEFFRLPESLKVIGDCGAFSYVAEDAPPVSVSEVIDFYENIGVDEGVSVDHVILGFQADSVELAPRDDWVDRQAITLELAADFYSEHKRRGCRFTPMGAAQGWSPNSYAASVERLQEIGYTRIAIGGMVSLSYEQIITSLEAIDRVRSTDTQLHLLGISRAEHYHTFRGLGVSSLDSTSPFRQAFKDDRDNYYTAGGHYTALRIPSAEGNTRLRARIRAGHLDQRTVHDAEQNALIAVRAYDRDEGTQTAALEALEAYETIYTTNGRNHTEAYRATLEARPWQNCRCGVCSRWGVEVAIFRCTQRNKRRGFHNLWVFNQTMREHLARAQKETTDA
jgi:queuine/archaeosine tRNA-ribosyltransferase